MLDIEIKELMIGIEQRRRIEMICKFNNLKCKFVNGCIRNIKRTNIAYVEPHKVIINNTTYLFFDESNFIYIETLDKMIPVMELDKYLKTNK